ncbi:hypothetical protein V1954_21270 [Yersinia sp. 2538 StPb PI]|uniref:hypothetical protein n=1 Tax=Yersinia sp. 2538 StPb PI TaxID=3117405 RepID=UPI003FA44369
MKTLSVITVPFILCSSLANAEVQVGFSPESAVSQAYQQEFERLWAEGTPLNAHY